MWVSFPIVGVVLLPVLVVIGWVFYSRVESPWLRMAVSSLLAATFVTALMPVQYACCGRQSIVPLGLLMVLLPIGIPYFAMLFRPSFLTLCGGIFAVRVFSYGLNALWSRIVGDRQFPLLQSSRVDDRIQRRLDG